MKNHICFVAGRSGGHIIPCLTLAQKIKNQDPSTHITFICTNKKLDKQLTHHKIIKYNMYLPLDNVPQKWYAYPRFFWHLLKSCMLSMLHFVYTQPKMVISTGGYIAIPVVIAARIMRIPVELWELNVQPGKASKFLAPFAQTIHCCFHETLKKFTSKRFKKTTQHTPYPVRYNATDKKDSPSLNRPHLNRPHLNRPSLNRNECIHNLKLDTNRTTLFIIGGSQGSREINTLTKQFIASHPNYHSKLQIIHQTGTDNPELIQKFYKNINVPAITFSYQNDLVDIYNAADIIISRAGAGTLAEIAFFEKKCIIIPLKTKTNNHQVFNAQAVAQEKPTYFTCADASSFEKIMSSKLDKIL